MSSNPYYIKAQQNKEACVYLIEDHVGCPNSSVHSGYYSCLQLVMGRLLEEYPSVLEQCFEDWEDPNKRFHFHTQVILRYEHNRRKDVKSYDKREKLKETITLLKKLKDYRIKADYKKSIFSSEEIGSKFIPKLEEFHKVIKTI